MIPNPRVGAVVFMVKDIEHSHAFYRDAFGLNLERLPGEDGGTWLMGRAGEISVICFEGEAQPGQSPIVVFELQDGGIDAVAEALAGKGVQVVTPVSEAPGGFSFDFADPDGHVWSCWQPNDKPR